MDFTTLTEKTPGEMKSVLEGTGGKKVKILEAGATYKMEKKGTGITTGGTNVQKLLGIGAEKNTETWPKKELKTVTRKIKGIGIETPTIVMMIMKMTLVRDVTLGTHGKTEMTRDRREMEKKRKNIDNEMIAKRKTERKIGNVTTVMMRGKLGRRKTNRTKIIEQEIETVRQANDTTERMTQTRIAKETRVGRKTGGTGAEMTTVIEGNEKRRPEETRIETHLTPPALHDVRWTNIKQKTTKALKM